MPFALAHTGVIRNDADLRWRIRYPRTDIETDSYIAVQLIEQRRTLNFDSLRYMAEVLEGSLPDERDELYFVQGDCPVCLYQFPQTGLYLYAATKALLERALKKLRLHLEKPEEVDWTAGIFLG